MTTSANMEMVVRAYRVLIGLAQDGQPITYKGLSDQIGLSHHRQVNAPLHSLAALLKLQGLPALTVLVVREDGSRGEGFPSSLDIEKTLSEVRNHLWNPDQFNALLDDESSTT